MMKINKTKLPIIKLPMGTAKKSKYGNIKTKINGIKFDSMLEGRRYTQLRLLERAGKIQDLKLQPKFMLQEGFTLDEVNYRPITYVSDFKYINMDGEIIIEDVKPSIKFKTEVYKVKIKLFLKRYGDEVIFKELFKEDI